MKKIKLLLLFGFSFQILPAQIIQKAASTHSATSYYPFPDSNVVWNFTEQFHCLQGGGDHWTKLSYTYFGDTLINGMSYHKLITPYYYSYITGSCPGGPAVSHPGGYNGAIRQDTAQRKVFFIEQLAQNETLLYDFNLQIGDTVKGYIASQNVPDIVIAIDSVLINSNYHKRWLINSMYYIYLIEGLGSTYGLIWQSWGNISDAAYFDLDCFKQNGITLYSNVGGPCNLILRADDLTIENLEIKIHPNPIQNTATLELPIELIGAEFMLYDKMGKNVRQERIHSGNFTFNRRDLSAGIYLMQLSYKGKILSKKIALD